MEDPRCCGTGTCIINAEGVCWCGQRWDGVRMCAPEPLQPQDSGDRSPVVTGPTSTEAGQSR